MVSVWQLIALRQLRLLKKCSGIFGIQIDPERGIIETDM